MVTGRSVSSQQSVSQHRHRLGLLHAAYLVNSRGCTAAAYRFSWWRHTRSKVKVVVVLHKNNGIFVAKNMVPGTARESTTVRLVLTALSVAWCAEGITSLLSAIAAGSLPCLEVLTQAGANPNVTAHGAAPLHIAAQSGNLEMIKCLLKDGGDPNTYDDGGLNMKPIQVAALMDNLYRGTSFTVDFSNRRCFELDR